MNKKIKQKVKIFSLSSIIAISLGSTGYHIVKDFNIKQYKENSKSPEEIINIITEKMSHNSYFNEYSEVYQLTNKEVFLNKFKPFINTYGKYLSNEEIEILSDGLSDYYVHSGINSEKDLYEIFIKMLNSDKYIGNGINKAYITSLIKFYFGYGSALEEDNMFYLYEKIVGLSDPRIISQYIYEQDIEGLIKHLTKIYCLDDDKIIREIILLFNENNSDNIDLNKYESNKIKIENMYKEILQNKLSTDKRFANSLHGQISKNYLQNDFDHITYSYDLSKNKTICIDYGIYGTLYLYDTEDITLEDNISYDELIKKCAYNTIYNAYNEEDSSFFTKLSYIINWDNLSLITKRNSFDIILDELISYFSSSEELAQFIVSFNNQNNLTNQKYFEIFTQKLINSEIDINTIAELKSLEKYYKEETYVFVDTLHKDNKDLSKIIKDSEESQEYITILNDFTFAKVNPRSYFEMIKQKIAETEQPFYYCENDLYQVRNWHTNQREILLSDDTILYSKEILPTTEQHNGLNYIYYDIPEGYENGEAVIIRENIKNENFNEPVNGIKTKIYDYNSGKYKNIYAVYIGPDIVSNITDNIVFKINYGSLKNTLNNEEGIKLKLEY